VPKVNLIKNFFRDEDGMGTVEIVIILAVLVSIALIFRNTIIKFVQDTLKSILGGSGDAGTVESGAVSAP
jgi:Flp pilus assembly pilin Flp